MVASYDYDAWGNITSSSGTFANSQPFRYAGYLFDSETGLYYLINRYYDPTIGRFISKDPRATISPSDSLAANPYLYVRNNPVNQVDPDGRGGLGAIYGRVMNTAGSPIVGAAVRWCNIADRGGNYIDYDSSGRMTNVVTTNGAGEYRFPVYEGIYHVYFDAQAYISQKQEYLTVYAGRELVAATVYMSLAPVYTQPAPQPQPAPAPEPAPAPAPTQPTQPAPPPSPNTSPPVPAVNPPSSLNLVPFAAHGVRSQLDFRELSIRQIGGATKGWVLAEMTAGTGGLFGIGGTVIYCSIPLGPPGWIIGGFVGTVFIAGGAFAGWETWQYYKLVYRREE